MITDSLFWWLLQAQIAGGLQPLVELGVGVMPLMRFLTHPAILDDSRPEVPNTLLAAAYENLDLGSVAAALEAVVSVGSSSSASASFGAPASNAATVTDSQLATKLSSAVKVAATPSC
jgi:hypothetical protein